MSYTGQLFYGPREVVNGNSVYRAPDGQLYFAGPEVPGSSEGMMVPTFGELYNPAAPAGNNATGVMPDGSYYRDLADGTRDFKWINSASGWDGVSAAAPGNQQSVWSVNQPDVSLAEKSLDGNTPSANPFGLATSHTADFMDGGLAAMIAAAGGFGAAGMGAFGGGSAAAGGTGAGGGAAAAGGGAEVFGAENFLFPGEADVFNGSQHLGSGAGTGGWTTGDTSLGLNGASTVNVTGQLPLNSFPGQTNSLGGALASLGVSGAASNAAGSAAGNAVGGAAAGGTPGAAAGSAISRIMNGTATDADYAQILGAGGAAALGAFGASQQANAFRDLANQARSDRAPFLAKANEWMANPQSYYDGPGKASLNGVLRGLSVNGNPLGNATSLALATEAGMRDWRGAVTGFGNLGLAGEDTRAQIGSNAINSDAGVWNAIGGGIADVTRPRNSLTDLYRNLRNGGLV